MLCPKLMRKGYFLPLIWIVFHGCHLGPDYEVPEAQFPEHWKAKTDQAELNVDHWWDIFNDEMLSDLEHRAIENNPDLYSALQRVAEARGVAGASKADLYPQVGFQPTYTDTGELIELYGVPQGVIPGLKSIVRVHEQSYQLPLNMNYEVDLWEKNWGKFQVFDRLASAELASYQTSLLTLTTDLASNYFNALSLDTQIGLLEKKIQNFQALVELRKSRNRIGVDSYLEVLNVQKSLDQLIAELDDAKRQRVLFENAIAVLIGMNASEYVLETNFLKEELPMIPPGLPSSLMVRRPDIAEAERKMAASHALIGVAYATFFPSFNLTGTLGFLSPELNQLMTWQGRLWSWGVSIFESVFDGWRRSSYLDVAKAQFEESLGVYEKTVLTAFQEVENALNNLEYQSKESIQLYEAYQSASEISFLSSKRYQIGVINRMDAIRAENEQIDAKRSWINVMGNRYQSTIQLIKAIGGDFSQCE